MICSSAFHRENAAVPLAKRLRQGWFAMFAVLCALAGTVDTAASGLTWNSKTLELSGSPEQKEIKGSFHFRNASSHPISIVSTSTSCGCTVVALEKKNYAPGESGELPVTFVSVGREGLQEKTIQVVTDEPHTEADVLQVRVNIPSYFGIAPNRFLFWPQGGARKSKTLTLTAHPPYEIVLARAVPSQAGLDIAVETVAAGREYRMTATPKAGDAPLTTTIALHVEIKGVGTRIYDIYALVR